MGSAWYPESQGYIEGRHKPINQIPRAYAATFPDSWAIVLHYAQWALGGTAREDRQGHSPFELVTGLTRQGHSEDLFRNSGCTVLSPAGYVSTLQNDLRRVHDLVRNQLVGELT